MTLLFKNCSLLKIIYLQIRLDFTRLGLSCETQGILENGVDKERCTEKENFRKS